MSDLSDEPGQGWGITPASDRSPQLSRASASPPGHPSGQGLVLPRYSHNSSTMSIQNILNSEMSQSLRPESYDSSSAAQFPVSRTPPTQIEASQWSMMAVDQLGGGTTKTIHNGTIEIYGNPPTQVSKGFNEIPYSPPTPPAGVHSVNSARDTNFTFASPPQSINSGISEEHPSHKQTVLTPVSMSYLKSFVSTPGSGDDESGRVSLANAIETEISSSQDVRNSITQSCAHGVLKAIADFPPSLIGGPSEPAGIALCSCTDHQYSVFSSSTAKLHGSIQHAGLRLLCGEADYSQTSGIMDWSDSKESSSGSSIQLSGAVSLDGTTSLYLNMSAQHDNNLSSSSFVSAYPSVGEQAVQASTQPPLAPPQMMEEYGNPLLEGSIDCGVGPADLDSMTDETAREPSIESHIEVGQSSTYSDNPGLTADGAGDTIATIGLDVTASHHDIPPAPSDESIIPLFLQQAHQMLQTSSAGLNLQPTHDNADIDTLDYMVDDLERNYDVVELLEHWTITYGMKDSEFPPVGDRALKVREWKRPDEVLTHHLHGDLCDPQGINWAKLGTTRENARKVRNRLYVNYTNIKHACPSEYARDIVETENYFRFRRTDTRKMACLSHFQLRNLLCATSKNDLYYAGRSKVLRADRSSGVEQCVMDFSHSDHYLDYTGPMKISTLAAGHGVLIAGGFGGEYALKSLSADFTSKHVEGVVTEHDNGITNHIHTIFDRLGGAPHAIFASNDCSIRTLDCTTNTFIQEHKHRWAVNCTATSPDGRLRVVVGDTRHAYICNADTGRSIIKLRNHRDFGFACAWADDGIHVATGNQDATVQVWDARMWNHPLQIIASEIAGVRSLRFSPVGGGKRVLLMADPADIISVVDAESFASKQRFDVFGEIGGISFTPDGSEFVVANTDRKFGGLMEYERIGYGEQHGTRYLRRREIEDGGDDYWDEKEFEWAADVDLDHDDRVAMTEAHRQRRGLGLDSMIL